MPDPGHADTGSTVNIHPASHYNSRRIVALYRTGHRMEKETLIQVVHLYRYYGQT